MYGVELYAAVRLAVEGHLTAAARRPRRFGNRRHFGNSEQQGTPSMRVRILLPLLAIATAAAFIPGSRAESPAAPGLDKEAVRKIVREYMIEHPEVIEEAIRGLQAKRESRKQDRVRAALRQHDKALRSHPMSPVSGNPKGDVHPSSSSSTTSAASGKSYSMAFFAEKVRRKLEGNFTFLLMTDRNDLDSQIYKTFAGCGIADDQTPRAVSGADLEKRLKENHRYVFSLIHKFNKDVDPERPYSERDDIIVISDEAHRTQAGRLARNMRVALPNASFIGFTGTPLFMQDELTKRIFGGYVSRYDFKRSEEDGATVKLVYDNRGEKLGVARLESERPDRGKNRGGRARPRPGGAAGEAAGAGLRGRHSRRTAQEDRGRFRRALRNPMAIRQVDAGLHRQDHLCPHVPDD